MVSPLDVKAKEVVQRRKSIDPRGTPKLSRAWMDEAADLITAQAARIAELERALEEATAGSIDVSGSAIILGYPRAKEWMDKARALSKEQADG